MYIYPYKLGSKTVSSLKEALGAKIIRLQDSRFKGDSGKPVLNWGNSTENVDVTNSNVLNKPECVGRASNKLTFFESVENDCNVVPFTADVNEVVSWLKDNRIVVARKLLQAHSGKGITIFEDLETFETVDNRDYKIYTQYVPKKHEYRVHVFCGEVIDLQKKSIRKGTKPSTWLIRSHDNGFIFTRENAKAAPDEVKEQAILACQSVGLDFGAVDVIYNSARKKAYVLEVNTAPGLEGTTLYNYTNAINKAFNLGLEIKEPTSEDQASKIKNLFELYYRDEISKDTLDNSLIDLVGLSASEYMKLYGDPLASRYKKKKGYTLNFVAQSPPEPWSTIYGESSSVSLDIEADDG